MLTRSFAVGALYCLMAACVFQCSTFEYDNPIDISGTNRDMLQQHPEWLLDANDNGIVDYWELGPCPECGEDTIAPTVTLIGKDTVTIVWGDEADMTAKLMSWFSYADDREGELTVSVDHTIDFFSPNFGKNTAYTITYLVMDEAGNKGSAIRYVWVKPKDIVDTVKPLIIIPDTFLVIDSGSVYTDDVSAWDNVDLNLTGNIITTGKVNTATPGTYVLIYTVSDAAGNPATGKRTVIVPKSGGSDAPPVITLVGPDTLHVPNGMTIAQYKAAFVDPGYTVTDDKDSNITEKVQVSEMAFFINSYWIITYNVTDNGGNAAATKRRYINTGLPPGTAPVIDLHYPDYPDLISEIVRGEKWVEPGYSASDVIDNDLKDSVKVDSSDLIANIGTVGTYEVVYTVTNSIGLSHRVTRTVKVVKSKFDTEPPVITLLGRNPDTVQVGSSATYKEPGYEAMDEFDGDMHDKVVISSNVKMNVTGKYSITYSATDAAGWVGKATRTVQVVKDTTAGNIFIAYGVPAETPLPGLTGKTYLTATVDGDGPDLSVVTSFNISWDATNKQLNTFSLQCTTDPYYRSLLGSIQHTFGSGNPEMTLSGTGITGLNGKYYIAVNGSELYWVSQTGKFAIIWK